jgi:O6-methylguanine-DNA--protein-cysteine methyltransferase
LTEAFSLVMNSMTLSRMLSLLLASSVIGAVARACTRNSATLLIPCHPVVRKTANLVDVGEG